MSSDQQGQDNKMTEPKGHQHVFEIFLFVNPLDELSLTAEKELLQFVDESHHKIYFRLIITLDYQTVREYCRNHQIVDHSADTWNRLYQVMYDICLGYKAALMQGKKKGRTFLLNMQSQFGVDKVPFSQEAMEACAKDVGLDIDIWKEDIACGRAKRDYMEDLQLAQKLEISTIPTFIMFDNYNYQYGIKVEKLLTASELHELTKEMEHYSDAMVAEHEKTKQKLMDTTHIHLIQK